MSRKSSSFLIPFLLTFVVCLSIGLSWLYFGYYRHKIATNNDFIAQISNIDTSKSDLNGLDQKIPNGKPKLNPNAKKSSDKSNSGHALTTTSRAKKNKGNKSFNPQTNRDKQGPRENAEVSGSKPSGKRSSNSKRSQPADRSKSKYRKTKKPMPSADDFATKKREPAYSEERDSSSDEAEVDNPLLNALKKAGARNAEGNSRDDSSKEPSRNPFEFLLNKGEQAE